MRTIFHITTRTAWEKATAGVYETASLATEGFIHFSRPEQVIATGGRYYHGHSNLVLLQVNQEKVTAPIKYEGITEEKFPHVYGPLNLDAVISCSDFIESAAGFLWPAGFSMVGETLLRRGHLGDEAEIASVHTHAWQQSYGGLIPESVLSQRPLSFRRRMNSWSTSLGGGDQTTIFVAESSRHGLIAFCAVGPGRGEEFASAGETLAIYCLNEYKGRGIGAALFRMGQAHLKTQGFTFSYLWVLQENPAKEFYRRMGGEMLALKKIVEMDHQPVQEVAFHWRL